MSNSPAPAATVVAYTIHPDKAEALRDALQRYLVPAARQGDGYRGFLVLDQGEGKRLAVVVFDSAENARAAQQRITVAARDHGVYELMAGPSAGSFGTAIVADGIFDAT